MLSDPEAEYRDPGPGYYEQRESSRRQTRNHVRSLERLGWKVTIEPQNPGTDLQTGEIITRTPS
jgi:transposase